MEGHETAINAMPSVLFREIHKNAFLKRHSSDKRAGFPRRPERVWAVFCVHDDTEAFLELYPDHKAALSHKPDLFVSLKHALHISPSICGQAEEFEFAVTLPTQVLRLAAPTWDAMMEWVDTLRNKLRELRVLAPKENLYTKMPEPKHALLPTRDPTSPLPLPPVGPCGLLPGVENPTRPLVTNTSPPPNEAVEIRNMVAGIQLRNDHLASDAVPVEIRRRHSNGQHSSRDRPVCLNGQRDVAIVDSNGSSASENFRSDLETESRAGSSVGVSVASGSVVVVNDTSSHELASSMLSPSSDVPISPESSNRRLMRTSSVPSSSNVTVIEVPPPPSPHYEHLFIPEGDNHVLETRVKLERVSSAGLIPRVPPKHSRDGENRPTKPGSPSRVRNTSINGHEEDKVKVRLPSSSSQQSKEPQHTSVVAVKAREPALPPKEKINVSMNSSSNSTDTPGPSSVIVSCQINSLNGIRENGDVVAPICAAFQPPPASLNVRDIPLIGGHQRRRRRSSSSDAGPALRGIGGADLIRVAPAEAPEASDDVPRRTLRETQVCQLRREMAHAGGVRLPLRRKDCVGGIALVDISNAVWVAGWKQREHPMLYNALHIGDQVISIGDAAVRCAAEAQKMLRGSAGPAVDLVVRRLPLGVVLALERPRSGGDVGLTPDPNSPAEVTVVPGGAAAKAGLPPRTATIDGLSLTTWTLTEVNSRPLNLFCKPTDVAARLNSVGKELSVLVQPSDFIKLLRKQLKTVRGHKDYLLQ